MFHLRLTKAMSYTGCGFSATKNNPDVFTEDKVAAEALASSGYFQFVEENAGDTTGEGEKKGKTLDEMTRAELETFATYKNVSVKGLFKKTDIIAKLREVLSPEETSGIIEYGSPTMTELQQ